MKNVLIHYLAPWEMEDEKTGKKQRGYSLQFITPYTETREGAIGFRGTKTSIRDVAVFEKLAKLPFPIVGDLVLEAKPGADNKLTAVVVDVVNARPVALFKDKASAA